MFYYLLSCFIFKASLQSQFLATVNFSINGSEKKLIIQYLCNFLVFGIYFLDTIKLLDCYVHLKVLFTVMHDFSHPHAGCNVLK